MRKTSKKAQEEIVGFALIIIIVAVIIVVFLSFMLRQPSSEIANDHEAEGFVMSILPYTTDCASTDIDFYSIRRLIRECDNGQQCADGRDTCEVLDNELKAIVNESWFVGQTRPVKGYKLEILEEIGINQYRNITTIKDGNETGIYQKGLGSPGGSDLKLFFTAYY